MRGCFHQFVVIHRGNVGRASDHFRPLCRRLKVTLYIEIYHLQQYDMDLYKLGIYLEDGQPDLFFSLSFNYRLRLFLF